MRAAVILLGGDFTPQEPLLSYVKSFSFSHVIACDGGLEKAKMLGLSPDFLVGDFDSVSPALLEKYQGQGAVVRRFPVRKDDTDGELGLRLAKEIGAEEVLFLGGLGGRLDHTMGNIFLLGQAYQQEMQPFMTDGQSLATFLKGPVTREVSVLPGLPYISLIPLKGDLTGVTLEGFSYPLTEGLIPYGRTLGISNELTGEKGTVTITGGEALFIRTRDQRNTKL